MKPEIGKKRPVVIVKAHKRYRMALIIPLTTQKPLKETAWITYIPKNILK
ncbi:MAG: type II toxin-antitoxin system PemK/MazF family toxin [Candidatus Peribacteria bacterium]|nr:type II toxin-antitoxin system PemK/MazF family toxin [Candidatus Peribacteria bacterium]